MSSKCLTTQQQDDEIKSVLHRIGFSNVNKIASTLQGGIWEGIETAQTLLNHNTNVTKVIKVTNKYLHNHSISIKYNNNKRYKIVENILKEKSILEYLTKQPDAPKSIVKYHNFFQSNSHFYLVMQNGGRSLFEFITKAHKLISNSVITIKQWQKVIKKNFTQMIECIEYIHNKNVCHYDLSLENFLINDIKIKETINSKTNKNEIEFILDDLQITLCDFGLAEYFEQKVNFISNKWCGKINYQSPEIKDKKYFDPKSNDIWGLGICLWNITVGTSPFKTAHKSDALFVYMMKGHVHINMLLKGWDKDKYVDDEWIALMKCFFQYENKRISIPQIKKHAWFK